MATSNIEAAARIILDLGGILSFVTTVIVHLFHLWRKIGVMEYMLRLIMKKLDIPLPKELE